MAGGRWRVGVLAAVLVWTAAFASGQEAVTEHTRRLAKDQSPPPASIADMAWLVGHWTGDGLGGRSEEIWSPAERGVMMGMYRNTKDGSAVFYEFLTLREEAGSLVLRLKHFNPDMTGWEEKNESRSFAFVGHKDGAWHFEGMAFKPAGPDAVTIYLAIEDKKTGAVREVEFHYKRVAPPLAPRP